MRKQPANNAERKNMSKLIESKNYEMEEGDELRILLTANIAPNRHQPRKTFDLVKLQELADSIDAEGLIQPIIVRRITDDDEGREYELIAGERRLRAVRDVLSRPRIAAIVKNVTESTSRVQALIENAQRSDLNPIEEAIAIKALMDAENLTQEQVAARIGKSRAYVGNFVRLVTAAEDVQTLLQENKIDANSAIALLTLPKPEQSRIANQAVKHGWNQQRIRQAVTDSKESKASTGETAQKPTRKPRVKDVEGVTRVVLVEFEADDVMKEFVKLLTEQGMNCLTRKAALERAVNLMDKLKKIEEHEGVTQED